MASAGEVLALVVLCFALGFIPIVKSHPAGNSCHAHLFSGGDPDPHSEPIPGCLKTSGVIYLPDQCLGLDPPSQCSEWIEQGRRKQERQSWKPPANEPGKNRVRRLWD